MQFVSQIYFIAEYLHKADDNFISKKSTLIYPDRLGNSTDRAADFAFTIEKQTGHTPMSFRIQMFERYDKFLGMNAEGQEHWETRQRTSVIYDFQQDIISKYFEHQQKRIDQGIEPDSGPA